MARKRKATSKKKTVSFRDLSLKPSAKVQGGARSAPSPAPIPYPNKG